MNALQEAMLNAGLVSEEEVVPLIHLPEPVKYEVPTHVSVRIYFADDDTMGVLNAISEIKRRLKEEGWQDGHLGDILQITAGCPPCEKRRWVDIKCLNSHVAAGVLTFLRTQEWPNTWQVGKITMPGYQF